jgi:hypothetical protein
MSRDTNLLCPEALVLYLAWKKNCDLLGLPVRVTRTWSSIEEQWELFKRGREEKDNQWIITSPSKVVTWCPPGRSKHVRVRGVVPAAEAFDFCFEGDLDGDGKLSQGELFGSDRPWGLAIAIGLNVGLRTIAKFNSETQRWYGDLCHLQWGV